MSKKIKISKKELNALIEIINHIYGSTYENLWQDEMKEEGHIKYSDDELAEILDSIIKKRLKAKKS